MLNEVKYILTMNPASGVSLVSDTANRILALVNGNLYRVTDGRPVTGEGRQLRDASREAIASMLDAARAKLEELTAAETAPATIPTPPPANDVKDSAPRSGLGDALEIFIMKALSDKAAEQLATEIFPAVEAKLVEMYGLKPVQHVFQLPDLPKYETTEILHEQFDAILNVILRGHAVYAYGPAGTGKSYLARQLANVLNRPFYSATCVLDDVQLKGYMDANGNYHGTEFRKAFENGGVFLLDELDASDENVATMLNDAIANRSFPFPDKAVQAHPDFVVIAAGNTCGQGADDVYTGRRPLDAATMDRFVFFAMDYDRRIEEQIARGNKSLCDFADSFRRATSKAGVRCICTYRAVKRLADFDDFMDKGANLAASLVRGLDAADVRMIADNMDVVNEWTAALQKLARGQK